MGIRQSKPGLLDVLTTGINATAAIHIARRGTLSVMTLGGEAAGALPSASLVGLRQLIRQMEQQYDTVLVNAPPMNPSADGLIVSGTCQQVVIVVRSQATSSQAIYRAMSRLSRVKANLLGIIVDGCPVESTTRSVTLQPPTGVVVSYT